MRDRVCQQCGREFRVKRRLMVGTYCSRACMAEAYRTRMKGSANPNFRGALTRNTCEHCFQPIVSYKKDRRFCSTTCRDASPAFREHNRAQIIAARGGRGVRDRNHAEVVQALRDAGAVVFDLSREGYGMPDLAVHDGCELHLMEIKNPDTWYGRRGLSAKQRDWAQRWAVPVHVVRTPAEALDAIGFTWDRKCRGE